MTEQKSENNMQNIRSESMKQNFLKFQESSIKLSYIFETLSTTYKPLSYKKKACTNNGIDFSKYVYNLWKNRCD